MKNTIKIAFAIVFCLMVGVAANAQVIGSGTVDFSVTVAPSFDIRNGGPTVASAGVTATGAVTANGALSTTLTITDASPNVNNATLSATVPIRLRSNANYELMATRTGMSSASATDFEGSDISMSVSYVARSGAQVNTGGTDAATAAFAGNVGALNSSSTQIATGQRISNGGNTVSTDNFITANLNFSAPRLFYTPTTYTDQVTVSIVAP